MTERHFTRSLERHSRIRDTRRHYRSYSFESESSTDRHLYSQQTRRRHYPSNNTSGSCNNRQRYNSRYRRSESSNSVSSFIKRHSVTRSLSRSRSTISNNSSYSHSPSLQRSRRQRRRSFSRSISSIQHINEPRPSQRICRPNAGVLAMLIRDQVRTNDRMDREEVKRADAALKALDPTTTERARLMTEFLRSGDHLPSNRHLS